jgi:hypothetical protein
MPGRNSTGSPMKAYGRRTIGIKFDQEDYDELQKQYQDEQDKTFKLQEDITKLAKQFKDLNITAKKLLNGKLKIC